MRLHLKVDTGMNRVGVQTLDQARALLETIAQEDGLLLEGLMTHFAVADEADKTYTEWQNARFQEYIALARSMGFSPIVHAANSGGALDCPGTSYDMVRVGIAMYGCYPSAEVSRAVKLEPALSLHTHISFLKMVNAGDKCYGCTFEADRPCASPPSPSATRTASTGCCQPGRGAGARPARAHRRAGVHGPDADRRDGYSRRLPA